jgi:uncharacterized protein (TIGR02186 family)
MALAQLWAAPLPTAGLPTAGLLTAGLLTAGLLAAEPAMAQLRSAESPLVTGLSGHLIAITSNFTGAELLLYGTIEQSGDVVIVVRGPGFAETVRKKVRIAGIWVNSRAVEFDDVPGYYAVLTERRLDEVAPATLLARLEIGPDNLRILALGDENDLEVAGFKQAIVRTRLRQGLYRVDTGAVTFEGRRLFRARVEFPSSVPVGTYRVEAYLIQNDRVVAAQVIPLFVDKQGMEQAVYDFAQQQPHLYGLLAVLSAILVGWIAAAAFRRA